MPLAKTHLEKGCGKRRNVLPACMRTCFSGVGQESVDAIDVVFEHDSRDPVVLGNIPFYSMCEHHLLPFFGLAHLGYIPNGKIAGLSKLARALQVASSRPQVQERLTSPGG